MKNKKVAALLLTMALCAGMAVPQSMVAFAAESTTGAISGSEESVPNTESDSSSSDTGEVSTEEETGAVTDNYNAEHIDQNYPGTEILWQAYCDTEEKLLDAFQKASTDQEKPTYIWVTKDITMENSLTATTCAEVPAGTYVFLQSAPDEGAPYWIKGNNTGSTATDANNAVLKMTGKEMTLSNIIIDGAANRRCISYESNDGILNLKNGTSIRNGGCTVNSNSLVLKGLGIYVPFSITSTTTVNMFEGAEITSCNFSSKTKAKTVLGKAIHIEGGSETFNMYGGKIYANNDFYEAATYTTSTTGLKLKGADGTVYCCGTFNMTGGEISGNASIGGAAVHLTGFKDSVIKNDAKIQNNIMDTEEADSAGLTSTKINTTYWHKNDAGGIFKGGTGKLTIEGDVRITDNEVKGKYKYVSAHMLSGGGIHIKEGAVEIDGGVISDNRAAVSLSVEDDTKAQGAGNGGGIYIESGSLLQKGGTIKDNQAVATNENNLLSGNGGGVYAAVSGTTAAGAGATFEMTGGTISNNSAALGKDLYVANYLKYGASATASTFTDVMGSPEIKLSGSSLKIGNVYLPKKMETDAATGKSELTITGSLIGSDIGIQTETDELGTVIANAAEGYAGLSIDSQALHIKDPVTYLDSTTRQAQYTNQTNQIVLVEKALSLESIAKADIGEIGEYTYDGTEKKPQPTVMLNGVQLTKEAYSYTYMNNKNVGTATIIISGNSPYTDWTLRNFVINPLSINADTITAEALPDRYFTGEEIVPADVNLTFNGTKLEKDKDYTLEYHNNTNVGTASVTVTGKGNFTGERTLTFEIKGIEDNVTEIKDGAALKESIESLQPGDTSESNPKKYTLTKNISITDGITVPEGQYVEITGNHMTMSSGQDNYAVADESGVIAPKGMFVVGNGSSLTLADKMTLDGKYQERLVYVCEGGTFEAEKGVTLTGGRATDQNVTKDGNVTTVSDVPGYGGQCICNFGTTTFCGTIQDNVTKYNGYGAIYNNHVFNLGSGAMISDVTVYKCGAIYNDIDGVFVMDDATISGTASVVPGDTVGAYEKVVNALDAKAIFNYGSFTMKSGEITNNRGNYPTITNSGTFTMMDGTITGNDNDFNINGGNGCGTIYQRRYDINDPDVKQPVFTMSGGEISRNKAMYNGGGVYLADGTFTMDGENAVIRDNTVTSKGNEDSLNIQYFNNGGGIFVQSGTFELKNGTIEGNKAYLQTENAAQKQAFNGGKWYYNSNGTPSETGGQAIGSGNGSNKHYGLGAAIYIGGGTLKLSGGTVNGNLSAPLNKDDKQSAFPAASGIYVAGEGVVEMSGAPVVSDVIYLEKGKNITITDKLTGTEPYTVYQTENDLKLKEDVTDTVGKAVASYKTNEDGSTAYQETDGNLFKLYAYNDTYDYAANKAYTHYTAFADDGIYVNIDDIDISKLKYYFANADMTAGIPSYVYNGAAQTVKISAPVERWLDEKGNPVDAGSSLAFTVEQDAIVNAGTYNVTVKPDLSKPGGYHYTGETSLQFAITPRDLSVPIYEYDNDGNLKKDENGNYIVDRLYETSYSFKDNISYNVNDPDDMEYKPASEVKVNLGILTPTTLVEGTDYKVTYSNNKSGSKENITATITGIGNYQGVLAKNVDTGIKVKDLQTLKTSVTEANVTAGDPAVSIGAETTDSTATITYKSSDESVATVDANGQVTPLSKGTVKITVTASETATSRPVQQEVTFNVAANPAVVDQEAADNVTRLVNNLNTDAMTVDNLSTSKTSVDHARAAYEALTEAQKEKVPQDTLDKLTAAEQKIKALEDEAAAIEKQKADQAAAAKVEEALNALPTADQMNAGNYSDAIKAITAAESAYNTLTDAQKAYVSADAKEKLDAAKAKAGEIEAQMNQDAVDLAKAQAVSDQIAALPKATEISKQTIAENEAAVKAARAAYNALTDAQKDKVPQEALAALVAAENKVAEVQKAIADAAAAEIPEISLVQTQNNAVKPVTNEDGSQGLVLDLDKNGQIIITLGDNTHPILDAENKAIDNDYVFGTAVKEINQNGDVIPSDLEVAEIFNIDWYVNGEKQEFDDSMYVTFGAASVKASDTTVVVLHQHDGEWTQLDVAAYGDGWVKAKFDGFSPAVVLVAHSASEDTSSGSDTSGSGGNTDTSGNGGSDSSDTSGTDTSGSGGNTDASGNAGSSTVDGGNGDTSGNNGSDNGTTGDNGSGNTTDGTTTDNAGVTNAETTTQGGTVQGTTSPYVTSGQGTWSGTGTTATPVSSTAATNAVSTPKTGDRTNMPATYATLLAALAALFGAGFVNKRRREEETE